MTTEQHSIWKSVILHLLPGALALLVYLLLARPVESLGFPSMMTWLVAIALINIPFEWGVMFYEGHKLNGRWSLKGVVLNREPIVLGVILVWTGLAFVAMLVAFLLFGPLTRWTETTAFAWVPSWFEQNDGSLGGAYPKANLLLFNLLNLVVLVAGIAVTEEFYFRGYLLPRLSRLGIWSVVLNSFLFALYHFTTPWALVQRTLFTLPMAFVAYHKRTLTPSIINHVLANIVNAVPGIQVLLSI
jgi:uncharacterized protein